MKLKDWLDQNKELLNCDLIIKVLKAGSYNSDDLVCELLLSKEYAYQIFKEYELKRISCGVAPNTNHYTIKLLLWLPT